MNTTARTFPHGIEQLNDISTIHLGNQTETQFMIAYEYPTGHSTEIQNPNLIDGRDFS
jgi:hypothetical protein